MSLRFQQLHLFISANLFYFTSYGTGYAFKATAIGTVPVPGPYGTLFMNTRGQEVCVCAVHHLFIRVCVCSVWQYLMCE